LRAEILSQLSPQSSRVGSGDEGVLRGWEGGRAGR
jgi:hypothetical protein